MKKPRVLLADDHSLILKGIADLLKDHYQLVETVEDGKALLAAALRLKPDVVVLDISMPILSGIDAAREIKKALPATHLVFLTMHSNAVYLRKALEVGASGYVLKSGAAEQLLDAISDVRNNRIYISPDFGEKVIDDVRRGPGQRAKVQVELTERQREILQLICKGKQNKEIAAILHVSVKTVEFHRGRLMTRLGAHSVTEMMKAAIQEGLIDAASI